MWMIRAGSASKNIEEFVQHGIVALGDKKLGPLATKLTKDDLLALYAKHYPEEKEGSRMTWASQLLRLLYEIKVGDAVITFDRDRRLYFVGTITSEYEWAPAIIEDKPQLRRAKWTHQVPRDLLSVTARNTLGSTLALFKIPQEVADEIVQRQFPIGAPLPEQGILAKGKPLPLETDAESEADLRTQTVEKADEFIEDAISRLDWKQMQELAAGILRAMGYRTTVSAPGSDLGVDVFASPDGLGLQEPRIFVEVKHRPASAMTSKEIRAFLGGRKTGDRCLYVSTGGFTKDAHYEAERASIPLKLISLPDLRKLLIDHYENLDAEARTLVPLKRLYWPVA